MYEVASNSAKLYIGWNVTKPHVERNERGAKRLDDLFARARAIARHDVLCYIILMQDFCRAVKRKHPRSSGKNANAEEEKAATSEG